MGLRILAKKEIKHIDLNSIEDPSFLKDLSKKELAVLASDIRNFIIENVSETGGHLSSNLGVVELTIALHTIFNKPNDKLIFDVGHQAYTHKILTGRALKFKDLRKFDGLSGYINYDESKYDVWHLSYSGHQVKQILDWLYKDANYYMQRKYVKYQLLSSLKTG